jgi:hypothetical protein
MSRGQRGGSLTVVNLNILDRNVVPITFHFSSTWDRSARVSMSL